MIRYADGNEVRVGDRVIYDDLGEATVVGVFESADEIEREGLDEPAVAFSTKPYGVIHQPLDRAWDDTIVLVTRSDEARP